MKHKEILVFGASGQIGRHLIRKLTENNYKVIAVTRNIHKKGYILKTQANPGYLEVVEISSFTEENIAPLISKCSICINLMGILFEKKPNEFKYIHSDIPAYLSKISKIENLDQFIHISSLGVEQAKDSKYAISKVNGEAMVKQNFKDYVVLKPSLVYSVNDNFTTNFMTLINRLPFLPLYYEGKTKFTPLHASDFTDIIMNVIKKKIKGQTIECIGPEILSFKEIITTLMKSIQKKRLLISIPTTLAKITTKLLEILPTPLLTTDQLNLLKYDNISSGKYKTNYDLKFSTNKKFENEIEKYSYNWRTGGQYAKNNSKNL